MTATTANPLTHGPLEDGVDLYRGRFRARLQFPGARWPHAETFPFTPEGRRACNARALELRDRRDAGLAPDVSCGSLTLREMAAELHAIHQLRDLTAGGLEWWARILRPWREGPHAQVPVQLLNATVITRQLRDRAATHPKAARDELIGLKATLRHARAEHAAKIPDALLLLELPKRRPRRRRALTESQLLELALCAPARYTRLLLLQGMVGCRIGELLTLQRWQVDLATAGAETITIPEPKERRPKVIPLLPEEAALLRELLRELDDAPATLLFGMPDGAAWPLTAGRVAHAYFDRLVWQPTLQAAGMARGDLTSHDLRATAITLMRDRGISLDTCATRVGHRDGKLIQTIYDQGSALGRAQLELAAFARATAAATATSAAPAAAPEKGRS